MRHPSRGRNSRADELKQIVVAGGIRLFPFASAGSTADFDRFRMTARLSSPRLSRRSRALKHGAAGVEVTGTSPATTRERRQAVQYDREPAAGADAGDLSPGGVSLWRTRLALGRRPDFAAIGLN
jgi:hypothetical protein